MFRILNSIYDVCHSCLLLDPGVNASGHQVLCNQHSPLHVPLCHSKCIHLGSGQCQCHCRRSSLGAHIHSAPWPLDLEAHLVVNLEKRCQSQCWQLWNTFRLDHTGDTATLPVPDGCQSTPNGCSKPSQAAPGHTWNFPCFSSNQLRTWRDRTKLVPEKSRSQWSVSPSPYERFHYLSIYHTEPLSYKPNTVLLPYMWECYIVQV